MFRTSVLCLFTAVVLAQQPGRQLMAGAVSLKSGVTLRYKSVLASNGASPYKIGLGLGEGGIAVSGNNRITRTMIDSRSQSYFGYDMAIGAGDDVTGYLVTFEPPTRVDPVLKHERTVPPNSLKPMPLPIYPAPIIVHDGDTVAIDLMVSPDGKQKLTDYIEIYTHNIEPKAATTTAEPRDFTVDDGQVTFDPMLYTIWIQGQKYSGRSGFTTKPGATFWIGVSGQGRYILSLVPHAGFALAGAIRDNVVSFRDEGQEYEVRFLAPIAGAAKAWNLYMMHDPAFEPQPNQRNMVNMGTDRLENLLPKN